MSGVSAIALRVFSLVPLLTGLAGWCPFYALLGLGTRRPARGAGRPRSPAPGLDPQGAVWAPGCNRNAGCGERARPFPTRRGLALPPAVRSAAWRRVMTLARLSLGWASVPPSSFLVLIELVRTALGPAIPSAGEGRLLLDGMILTAAIFFFDLPGVDVLDLAHSRSWGGDSAAKRPRT